MVYLYNGLSFSYKKEVLIDAKTWINLGTHVKSNMLVIKDHKLYDCIYMKCLEWAYPKD